MSKKNIFVVEDEPLIRSDLRASLGEMGFSVNGEASDMNQALKWMEHKDTDLVLLDIELSGDGDGIDLAHIINERYSLPFLYLTAFYDDGTLKRARATNPAGYIVKPWSDDTLKATIEMAFVKKENSVLLDHNDQKLFIRHKGDIVPIDPEDILYAESNDNYTYLHTCEGSFLSSQTMKKVNQMLKPMGFIRVHKSWMVNLYEIERIAEGRVFVAGKEIPVGRVYRKRLMDRITLL